MTDGLLGDDYSETQKEIAAEAQGPNMERSEEELLQTLQTEGVAMEGHIKLLGKEDLGRQLNNFTSEIKPAQKRTIYRIVVSTEGGIAKVVPDKSDKSHGTKEWSDDTITAKLLQQKAVNVPMSIDTVGKINVLEYEQYKELSLGGAPLLEEKDYKQLRDVIQKWKPFEKPATPSLAPNTKSAPLAAKPDKPPGPWAPTPKSVIPGSAIPGGAAPRNQLPPLSPVGTLTPDPERLTAEKLTTLSQALSNIADKKAIVGVVLREVIALETAMKKNNITFDMLSALVKTAKSLVVVEARGVGTAIRGADEISGSSVIRLALLQESYLQELYKPLEGLKAKR